MPVGRPSQGSVLKHSSDTVTLESRSRLGNPPEIWPECLSVGVSVIVGVSVTESIQTCESNCRWHFYQCDFGPKLCWLPKIMKLWHVKNDNTTDLQSEQGWKSIPGSL